MAWDLIYWLICFCIDIALFSSSLYQYVMLMDLEADYINPFELSTRINQLVVPEFVVHGVFCALFLVARRWFMFLLTAPLTYYIVMLFVKQKHLIDVTEVFRVLNTEKKCRLVKLGVYFCLLTIIITRLTISAFNSLTDEEHAVDFFDYSLLDSFLATHQYAILICCVVATKFMIHLTLWSACDGDIFTSENAIAIWVELCVISFNNLGWKMTSQRPHWN